MTANVILVEAAPRRAADGVAETVRLAGAGAQVPYFYGGQHWRAGITAQPRTISSIGYSGTDLGTGGVPQALVISWSPSTRAQLNAMTALFWVDAAISIWAGPEGAAMPPLLLAGVVLDAAAEDGTLQIAMADPAANLKKPVLVDRFGGTGGADGPAEWAGRIRRRGWGRIFNVLGEPLDPPNNIYCFGDPQRPWQGFDAVRDKGLAADGADLTLLAWQGSVAATFAALQVAVATEGGGVLCPSIACIKWWTEPAGDLCVDARGETAGGYVETAPEIAARIIAARSALGFAAGTVAAAVAARPALYGWLADNESTTIAETLDTILGDVSLTWVLDAGAIALRRWEWTAPVASARSHKAKRVKVYKPVGTRRLGYRRNWNQMTRGEIAEILFATDVVFPDGTVLSDVQPAEAGATNGMNPVERDIFEDMAEDIAATEAAVAFAEAQIAALIPDVDDIADRILAAEGEIVTNSSSLASQAAQIDILETTASTTEGDLAQLTTRVAAGQKSNRAPNGGFENGLAGYQTDHFSYQNNFWGPHAASTTAGTGYLLGPSFTVFAEREETFSANMEFYAASGSFYLRAVWLDGADAVVGYSDPAFKTRGEGFATTQAGRVHFTAAPPPGASRARIDAAYYDVTAIGYLAIKEIKVETGSEMSGYTPEASVIQTFTAINTATAQIAEVETEVATVGAQVSSVATALTDAENDLAVVNLKLSAGGRNEILNPGFENALANWTSTGFNHFTSRDWGPYAFTNGAAGAYTTLVSDERPVSEAAAYVASADMEFYAATGAFYLEVQRREATGGWLFVGATGKTRGEGFSTNANNRVQVPVTFPAGTVAARVAAVTLDVTGAVNVAVREVMLQKGSVMTAYRTDAMAQQQWAAWSGLNSAYASINTMVSVQGVELSVVQAALDNVEGRTTAFWQVTGVAGSGRAQLTLYADANGGGGVDIIGDVRVSGSALFGGTVTADKFVSNAAVVPAFVYTSSTIDGTGWPGTSGDGGGVGGGGGWGGGGGGDIP